MLPFMHPEEVGRKHPIHWPVREQNNRAIIVFVTVCAASRKPILANPHAVTTILSAWKKADAWLIGRYVVMPDHVHFFCAPRRLEVPLKNWVRYWKSIASLEWPRREDQPIWQKDFWDRQLRHGESYATKWDYVWRNPVRHELATTPESWPWQGELNPLMWHEP